MSCCHLAKSTANHFSSFNSSSFSWGAKKMRCRMYLLIGDYHIYIYFWRLRIRSASFERSSFRRCQHSGITERSVDTLLFRIVFNIFGEESKILICMSNIMKNWSVNFLFRNIRKLFASNGSNEFINPIQSIGFFRKRFPIRYPMIFTLCASGRINDRVVIKLTFITIYNHAPVTIFRHAFRVR